MYHKLNWDKMGLFERMSHEIQADDSASVGEKMLLYWLIRELKPERIVETGTHRGFSTLFMAHAAFDNTQENPGLKTHVFTADPFNWEQQKNFDKFEEISSLISYYPKKGSEMVAELDGIDFAFIDGYHGKADVMEELTVLLPRLSPNATVIFHDCWYNDSEGVNEALEEAGLMSTWLPTTNAMRVYQKFTHKPRGRDKLYGK